MQQDPPSAKTQNTHGHLAWAGYLAWIEIELSNEHRLTTQVAQLIAGNEPETIPQFSDIVLNVFRRASCLHSSWERELDNVGFVCGVGRSMHVAGRFLVHVGFQHLDEPMSLLTLS